MQQRTLRSQQLPLPEPASLARSPLTEARLQQRTYPNDDQESEDEILLSPNKHKTRSKRSASPISDASVAKRLKFDHNAVENSAAVTPTHTRNNSEPVSLRVQPRTPKSRARSVPLFDAAPASASWQRRARSRSPSKERDTPILQTTFLSSLDAIKEAPMPPPPPPMAEAPLTPVASSSLPVLATPMSPLTPLPETPRPVQARNDPGFPRTIGWGTDLKEARQIDGLPTPLDSFPLIEPSPTSATEPTPETVESTALRATAEPIRPTTSTQSRLPRPSLMPPPPVPSNTKAKAKTVAKAMPPPPVPSTSRATPKNAFDMMMGSEHRGQAPKVKGKAKATATGSKSVLLTNSTSSTGASSSKPVTKPQPKASTKDVNKGKAKAAVDAQEGKKSTMKGQMRTREKPKPLKKSLLDILPDEELEPSPLPSPAASSSLRDLTAPMSPLTEPEDDKGRPVSPLEDIPKLDAVELPPLSPLTEPADEEPPAPVFALDETPALPPPSSSPTEEIEQDLSTVPFANPDSISNLPHTVEEVDMPSGEVPAVRAKAENEVAMDVVVPDTAAAAEPKAETDTLSKDTAAITGPADPAAEVAPEPMDVAQAPADDMAVLQSTTTTKVRPKSRAGKQPRAPPPLPVADRVTRSTSLKRKETDEDGTSQKTGPSFGVGSARVDGGPAKKQKVEGAAPSKIPIPSPKKASSSKTSTFASPTKASVARAAATKSRKPMSAAAGTSSGSPTKNRMVRASSVFSARPPPSFSRTMTEGSSSLQSLASALERLRAPPPERPNTSMGFSRDDSDPALSESTRSLDDHTIGLGRPSNGLQRATTVASIPSSSSSSSSILAESSAKAGPVQKPLTSFFGGNPGSTSRLMVGNGALLRGRGARVGPKVSRNPGLPSVLGSPTKGGAAVMAEEPEGDETMLVDEAGEEAAAIDAGASVQPTSTGVDDGAATSPRSVKFDLDLQEILDDFEASKKGKKRDLPEEWRKNASRRASIALQDLSKSVSLPIRPTGMMGPPEVPLGMRSTSSSYPSTEASGSGSTTGSATEGMRRSTRIAKSAADTSMEEDPTTAAPTASQLSVLKGCVVFVDVISEQGDDSLRSLYADTLKTLGARVLGSVGQTCTHIIYKNGLRSTYNKYMALQEPRPHLVGMEWVVKCAETHERQDEAPYLIDVDDMNTSAPKRRKTMMPRALSGFGEDSLDEDHSLDVSSTSITMEDDLTPLERARLRKKTATAAA
ncbi:BRCT domain-containing protein [Mycena kentingensis (nom. inval.)]|nr:BRCT domain-containing protein [Mycena kentingensis (nom. inval.)]